MRWCVCWSHGNHVRKSNSISLMTTRQSQNFPHIMRRKNRRLKVGKEVHWRNYAADVCLCASVKHSSLCDTIGVKSLVPLVWLYAGWFRSSECMLTAMANKLPDPFITLHSCLPACLSAGLPACMCYYGQSNNRIDCDATNRRHKLSPSSKPAPPPSKKGEIAMCTHTWHPKGVMTMMMICV